MNDFSAALNNFQSVQRRAAEREKESVAKARAGSRLSVSQSPRKWMCSGFTFKRNCKKKKYAFAEHDVLSPALRLRTALAMKSLSLLISKWFFVPQLKCADSWKWWGRSTKETLSHIRKAIFNCLPTTALKRTAHNAVQSEDNSLKWGKKKEDLVEHNTNALAGIEERHS